MGRKKSMRTPFSPSVVCLCRRPIQPALIKWALGKTAFQAVEQFFCWLNFHLPPLLLHTNSRLTPVRRTSGQQGKFSIYSNFFLSLPLTEKVMRIHLRKWTVIEAEEKINPNSTFRLWLPIKWAEVNLFRKGNVANVEKWLFQPSEWPVSWWPTHFSAHWSSTAWKTVGLYAVSILPSFHLIPQPILLHLRRGGLFWRRGKNKERRFGRRRFLSIFFFFRRIRQKNCRHH